MTERPVIVTTAFTRARRSRRDGTSFEIVRTERDLDLRGHVLASREAVLRDGLIGRRFAERAARILHRAAGMSAL